jgi:hypothetical protein
MFFIVIPQCLLINEELNGYIIINKYKIMIENYSFCINGYLLYQINEELKNYDYYIYNYNQIRHYNNFNNMSVCIKNNKKIFSNNVIKITFDYLSPFFINIKACEQSYICNKMYFNTNKEFIIENKINYLPSFNINQIL